MAFCGIDSATDNAIFRAALPQQLGLSLIMATASSVKELALLKACSMLAPQKTPGSLLLTGDCIIC
eukprot:scaffold179191_cov40-Prasinocladus_malaysianus.AAC.1